MKNALRFTVPLLSPALLLILSVMLLRNTSWLSPQWHPVAACSGFVLLSVSALLAWRFNRSRVFFSSGLLFSVHWLLSGVVPSFFSPGRAALLFPALSVLLPVNLLLLSVFRDRGITSLWGLGKFLLLSVQFALICLVPVDILPSVLSALSHPWLPGVSSVFPGINQTGLLTFLVTGLILLVRFVLSPSFQNAAFSGALCALFSALYYQSYPLAVPVFFASAGLMFMVTVIHDSYSMAFLDELTGIPSRRALRHELMKLSGRYTIAMLDIDFFKKFNDTYGHDVGDQVLKMVAGCIREVTGGGRYFRYGGEEFTVLFPGKNMENAIPHLEALRKSVEEKAFYQRGKDRPKKKPSRGKSRNTPGKALHVTISIGVAEKNERNKNPDDVIKAADSALYKAKKKGRNCVSK